VALKGGGHHRTQRSSATQMGWAQSMTAPAAGVHRVARRAATTHRTHPPKVKAICEGRGPRAVECRGRQGKGKAQDSLGVLRDARYGRAPRGRSTKGARSGGAKRFTGGIKHS
jgi:hypothetical protein